jgi:uncharacterized protein YcfJ
MDSIRTAPRLHPLMAAAAASVITVSIVGTAAITGLLPTSRGATSADMPAAPLTTSAPAAAATLAAPVAMQQAPMATSAADSTQTAVQPVHYSGPYPAPYVAQQQPAQYAMPYEAPARPAVQRAAPRPQVVHHTTQVVHHAAPVYRQQAAQAAPAQPNYLGIGAGAVLGGILGHQVGGGNGKKLATVAGVIGGGFLGNEVANRYKQ